MSERTKKLDFSELYQAFASLKDEHEIAAFLDDLCTINEMKSMQQRLLVAKLLDKGEQYSQIVKETGASTATISRVNRCLMYGSDGYRLILDRLDKKDNGDA